MDQVNRIEQLFQEYEQHRNNVNAMHEKMRAVTASVTSPRREVTVTVGQNGVLTGVSFPGSGYRRLTPVELTAIIMRAYEEAKDQVLDQAAELLTPVLPDGVNAQALVRGETPATDLMPAEPKLPPILRAALGLGRADQ